jgi:elongator complex protein 1
MVSDMGSVRTGTTNRSRTSKSTAKSSKNRKKAERKKFSVRRGSPMEHLGLMEEAK